LHGAAFGRKSKHADPTLEVIDKKNTTYIGEMDYYRGWCTGKAECVEVGNICNL